MVGQKPIHSLRDDPYN